MFRSDAFIVMLKISYSHIKIQCLKRGRFLKEFFSILNRTRKISISQKFLKLVALKYCNCVDSRLGGHDKLCAWSYTEIHRSLLKKVEFILNWVITRFSFISNFIFGLTLGLLSKFAFSR